MYPDTSKNVDMTRGKELLIPLSNGRNVASISTFRGVTSLHLRRFFGESDIKYPSRVGIALNRADFEHLISIQKKTFS
jgi:hypothetical protein